MGKVIMIQGTASNVGKSVLVTALCRIFRQDGFKVAPFKAQNMSLNSYVTPDGGEIGRAQAVQAEAAGIEPSVEMNPILLKPEADSHCQVVAMGRPFLSTSASNYYQLRSQLWPLITEALDRLHSQYEIIVIEGAGSPAEVNLKDVELVNMRIARHCSAPVLLVGDIDRGGVFASLLGTLWLLSDEERALVKALVVNKFRGDSSLFESGVNFLETKSGIPIAGIIPYFHDIRIAQEDSVALEEKKENKGRTKIEVAVIRLPRISNFDDFDPLEQAEVKLRYVSTPEELNSPDLIIIPGSKSTIADLDWMVERGLAQKIIELYRQGAFVIGICGGFQMLGKYILDPQQVESASREKHGLGLLPVTTIFSTAKESHRIKAEVLSGWGLLGGTEGMLLQGYEIHMGSTNFQTSSTPFHIQEKSGQPCDSFDGCLDTEGRALGTYIHGLFHNRELRQAMLEHIAREKGTHLTSPGGDIYPQEEYDRLADLVRHNLDMKLIYSIAGLI